MLKEIRLTDITPIEYYGTLYGSRNAQFTYSVARIIDKWYSYNWQKVTDDTLQLRLFLKKAVLFDELGIIGICNKYLLKFQNSDSTTIRKLEHLLTSEKDNDIRNAALQILNQKIVGKENKTNVKGLPLQKYLSSISSIDVKLRKAFH